MQHFHRMKRFFSPVVFSFASSCKLSMLSNINGFKVSPVPYFRWLCPVFMLAEGGGSLLKHLGIKKVLTENNYWTAFSCIDFIWIASWINIFLVYSKIWLFSFRMRSFDQCILFDQLSQNLKDLNMCVELY